MANDAQAAAPLSLRASLYEMARLMEVLRAEVARAAEGGDSLLLTGPSGARDAGPHVRARVSACPRASIPSRSR